MTRFEPLALLAFTFLLTGTASAQERAAAPAVLAAAAQESSADAPDAAEDARARRRVLHLSSGGVVRGKTRFKDGRWEVHGRAGWQALPEGAVTRARVERDLLRESERLARANGDDPGATERVRLASWMIDQGLYAEAVSELDRVLSVDPDHAAALAALPPRLIAVPSATGDDPAAARAAVYTFGAGASPTGREYAIRELRRAEDWDAVRAELAEELRAQSLRRRSFAAHALGRLEPGAELKSLLMHAVLDPSEEARRASAQAVAATDDPAVLIPIIRALNSSSSRVRTQAAEALGNARMEHAVEPLMAHLSTLNAAQSTNPARRVPHGNIFVGRQFAYIQDFDVEVAQFQAVADPQVNVLIEGDALDAGVHSIGEYRFTYESRVVRGSLAQLTGENPGYTNRAWLDWWDEHGGDWTATLARPDSEGARTEATPAR